MSRKNHPSFERPGHFLDYLTQVGEVQVVRATPKHSYPAEQIAAEHRGFFAIRPAAPPAPTEQED